LQKADLPLGRRRHYAVVIKGKMTSRYVIPSVLWSLLPLLLLLLLLPPQVRRVTCQLDSGSSQYQLSIGAVVNCQTQLVIVVGTIPLVHEEANRSCVSVEEHAESYSVAIQRASALLHGFLLYSLFAC